MSNFRHYTKEKDAGRVAVHYPASNLTSSSGCLSHSVGGGSVGIAATIRRQICISYALLYRNTKGQVR